MNYFLTLIITLSFSTSLFAQDFEVPAYSFEKKEDYAKYKDDILACIKWLEKTPIDKQTAKRKEASAFFIKWVEGSPDVSIELHEYVMDAAGENPDMLIMFMAGWTRYELENPSSHGSKESKDIIAKHLAGTQAMLKLYADNKKNGIKKSKTAEKLLKMSEEELKTWLNEKVLK